MLTVRIKDRPTLGNLQGPFEASLNNRGTWVCYSYELDKITKFFGPDRGPDDIFRQDVENFKAWLMEHHGYSEKRVYRAITVACSWYSWMYDLGFATTNPFYRMRGPKHAERPVEVIVT